MRGILEFDLPEDQEDFELAQKSGHLSNVINELDTYLRNKVKYGELPEEQEKYYQEIRDKLWELQND